MATATEPTNALSIIQDRKLPVANRVDGLRKLMLANKDKLTLGADKLMNPDRLIQVACLSIRKTPKLLNCSIASLFGALSEAAAYGWVCDGVTGQASIVPFGDDAVLIPGYKGLRDLVRRSGECDTVMESVHEGDEYEFRNPFELPHHIRSKDPQRKFAPVTHAYVIGRFKSGAYKCFTMSVDECKAHRDHYSQGFRRVAGTSKEADSPWSEKNPAFRVMCMKTVLLDAIHRGEFPMSVADTAVASREPSIRAVESSTISTVAIDLLGVDDADDSDAVIDEAERLPPTLDPATDEAADADREFQIEQIIDQQSAAIEAAKDPDLIRRRGTEAIAAIEALGGDATAIRNVMAARLDAVAPKGKGKQGSLI